MAFLNSTTKALKHPWLLRYQTFQKFIGKRNCHSTPIAKQLSLDDIKPKHLHSLANIAERNSILEGRPRPNLFRNLDKNESMEGKPNASSLVASDEEIRKELLKFDGGEIRMSKNDETGVALVKLSNEQRKNALTGKMMVELREIVEELEKWKEGKAVLVHSNGDCFCSGMDLKMIKEKSDRAGGELMAGHLQETLSRLEALPIVSAALVQGRAMGGGAELITAFDFRLFSPKAETRFVHSRMGVSTGIAGGGTRLTRLIGPSLALKYLLSAEAMDASTCLRLGLASVVFDSDDDLMDSAIEWLKPLISNRETDIVQSVKRIVRNATFLPSQEALHLEKDIFVAAWGGPALLSALEQNKKHK